MLSSESPLCFHWPRILYSLLDLILFELAVASTNFRQGLTSLTENELQEYLNIMQSATFGKFEIYVDKKKDDHNDSHNKLLSQPRKQENRQEIQQGTVHSYFMYLSRKEQ